MSSMPELPSLFNRLDFIGLLLPGYVVIIAYVGLFRADLILGKASVSFDLFSAIIFIIAGPVAGIALRQLHHGITALLISRFGTSTEYRLGLARLAHISLSMNDREKAEVDEVLADFDCSLSLGTGFVLLELVLWLSRGFVQPWLAIPLGAGAVLFFFYGDFIKKGSYNLLMRELDRKYPTTGVSNAVRRARHPHRPT